MSEPYGHSKDDRDGNISFLLVQLCKDISTAREAGMKGVDDLHSLEGIHDIHGFRARVKELNQCNDVGLNASEIGCKQILSLTRNKTLTMDAERRFTLQKGKLQLREMERKLAKAMLEENNETTVVRIEREAEREQNHAIHNNCKSMIKRRKIVASAICSSSIGGNVTVPLPSHQMTICNSVSGIPTAVITLSANSIYALSLPKKDGFCHTLR
jgi:hypothetical protein